MSHKIARFNFFYLLVLVCFLTGSVKPAWALPAGKGYKTCAEAKTAISNMTSDVTTAKRHMTVIDNISNNYKKKYYSVVRSLIGQLQTYEYKFNDSDILNVIHTIKSMSVGDPYRYTSNVQLLNSLQQEFGKAIELLNKKSLGLQKAVTAIHCSK